MKKYTLSLLFLLSAFTTFAQEISLSGKVLLAADGKSVPYVNIGILKKNKGTIADENGSYTLNLQPEHQHDSLTFSAVGYALQTLAVQQLQGQQTKATRLKEVVINSRKLKIKKLGVTGRLPFIWGVPDRDVEQDIYEYATFIPVRKYAVEALSVHFYLVSISLDSALFRINFYKNEEGLPGERLLEKSIVQKLSTKEGWVKVDLEPHGIYASEDFFVGLEYLPEKGAGKRAISLGGKLGGSSCTREASMGAWEKFSGASLSTYITVRQ